MTRRSRRARPRERTRSTVSSVEPRKPVGAPDARIRPRFVGPDTFARLPRLEDVGRARVAVLGVPFDSGTTYRPGARFGPQAIRAGSKLLRAYHQLLDVWPWSADPGADGR